MIERTLIAADALRTLLQSGRPCVLLDCSFDLVDLQAGARLYAQGHLPGALLRRTSSATCQRHQERTQRPPSAAHARAFRRHGRALGRASRRAGGLLRRPGWPLCRARLVDAALARSRRGRRARWRPCRMAGRRRHASDRAACAAQRCRALPAQRRVDAHGGRRPTARPARPSDGARRARRRAFPRRGRAARPGGRAHSRCAQPLLQGQPVCRWTLQARRRSCAPRSRPFGEPTACVHQCGSGVTACHNLLAMEHAGLTGSALYPGSWSEWCADPARPLARG